MRSGALNQYLLVVNATWEAWSSERFSSRCQAFCLSHLGKLREHPDDLDHIDQRRCARSSRKWRGGKAAAPFRRNEGMIPERYDSPVEALKFVARSVSTLRFHVQLIYLSSFTHVHSFLR
eukprot:gnl/TRDRNA2_/TRDRNA2_146093_c2_seq2.p1 gnl/TRDRNA2_/TRDRNA2_146093_c2~~gnl/TRDRNA2_/TRDRNA2_146093_c2_seq2.p1  ORF type:complete len:120 (+),score=9.68 gnl/TRDRNA2_/TRDRNA2_146093_c2_seq2:155-514(+)